MQIFNWPVSSRRTVAASRFHHMNKITRAFGLIHPSQATLIPAKLKCMCHFQHNNSLLFLVCLFAYYANNYPIALTMHWLQWMKFLCFPTMRRTFDTKIKTTGRSSHWYGNFFNTFHQVWNTSKSIDFSKGKRLKRVERHRKHIGADESVSPCWVLFRAAIITKTDFVTNTRRWESNPIVYQS